MSIAGLLNRDHGPTIHIEPARPAAAAESVAATGQQMIMALPEVPPTGLAPPVTDGLVPALAPAPSDDALLLPPAPFGLSRTPSAHLPVGAHPLSPPRRSVTPVPRQSPGSSTPPPVFVPPPPGVQPTTPTTSNPAAPTTQPPVVNPPPPPTTPPDPPTTAPPVTAPPTTAPAPTDPPPTDLPPST